MKIDILTLFPEMFEGPFNESIIKRAKEKGLVEIQIHNLRNWASDKHKTVDDRPYGGGAGMILKVDVIDKALTEIKSQNSKVKKRNKKVKTILLSAKGSLLTQEKVYELSKLDHLILIAGHYEGVDERVVEHLVDEEISIGKYILTGGEIPAMVITDAVIRLIPGVIKPQSLEEESYSPNAKNKLLNTNIEYPQYTRPKEYRGWKVPEVLLSGNHKKIENWRKKEALKKTKKVSVN